MKKEFWRYMEMAQRREPTEKINRDIVAAYIKSIPKKISDKIFSETAKEVFNMANWNAKLSQDEIEEITREYLLKITTPELIKEFKEYNPKVALFTIDTIKKAIEEHEDIIQSWILRKYKELFQKK